MIASLTLPITVASRTGGITLSAATTHDLPALMALMSDDPVAAARGDVARPADHKLYGAALAAVQSDPSNMLVMARDATGEVVATMQLTVIPGLARRGSTRLLVEGVRVSSSRRSAGIGEAMMHWVMRDAARATGASLVQLTSDARRSDAHRFYRRLGFQPSHVGFKYQVPSVRTRI